MTIVRSAGADDLPALLTLYEHLHRGEPPAPMAEAQKVWAQLLSSGTNTVFVIDGTENGLISSCTLSLVPNLTRGARPYACIENVVTHADHRKKGLANAVLAAAVKEAREKGCYKIFLATGQKDEATLRFYDGAGFKRNAKTYFEIR